MTRHVEVAALVQAWSEDPDGMPDDDREALLDWVRDLHQHLGSSLPVTVVWLWTDYGVARLSLAVALCEEAGLDIEI